MEMRMEEVKTLACGFDIKLAFYYCILGLDVFMNEVFGALIPGCFCNFGSKLQE